MTKDEALDLALEALELHGKQYPHMVKGYCLDAITAIKQARALDKKAENARELGLDYEPADGTQVSKVWWDGEKLMAKPIPLVDFYQPVQDELAYREAVSLATWLFKKHFAREEHYASGRVVWEPCDTTAGVISQIDNMVCGLVQPAATVKESLTVQPAAPVQEPVAWINAEKRTFEWNGPVLWNTPTVAVLNKIPLYTTPPAQPAPEQEPVARIAELEETVRQLNHALREATETPTFMGEPVISEPAAKIKGVDEYGPLLDWAEHWVNFPVGTKLYTIPPAAQPAPVQEPKQSEIFCGVDFADGVLSVSVLRRRPDDVAELLHSEQIELQPTAAQRQWVGLTDEEFEDIELGCRSTSSGKIEAMQKVEAKLKEKNGLHRQHVIDGSPCWCEPETSYTDPETGASVVVHKEPQ